MRFYYLKSNDYKRKYDNNKQLVTIYGFPYCGFYKRALEKIQSMESRFIIVTNITFDGKTPEFLQLCKQHQYTNNTSPLIIVTDSTAQQTLFVGGCERFFEWI